MEDKKPQCGQQIENATVATKYDETSERRFDERIKRNGNVEADAEQNQHALDDKAVISNLRRSNSVSMKASLFSKWQNHVQRENEPVKLKKNGT